MAGVPGRTGTNNPRQIGGAGLKSAESVCVERMPWDVETADPASWTASRIFDHLAESFADRGLTRDGAAGDLVRHIADQHWLRLSAREAIDADRLAPLVGDQCAYKLLAQASTAIVAGYRNLGVYPYGSVQALGEGDDDQFDFTPKRGD